MTKSGFFLFLILRQVVSETKRQERWLHWGGFSLLSLTPARNPETGQELDWTGVCADVHVLLLCTSVHVSICYALPQ